MDAQADLTTVTPRRHTTPPSLPWWVLCHEQSPLQSEIGRSRDRSSVVTPFLILRAGLSLSGGGASDVLGSFQNVKNLEATRPRWREHTIKGAGLAVRAGVALCNFPRLSSGTGAWRQCGPSCNMTRAWPRSPGHLEPTDQPAHIEPTGQPACSVDAGLLI